MSLSPQERARRIVMSFCVTCSLLLSGQVFSQPAAEASDLNIPSQSLADALIEFSIQTRQQLFFEEDDVAGKTSTPVSGAMTPAQALQELLEGTGLNFEQTEDGGLMVGGSAATESAPAEAVAPSVKESKPAEKKSTENVRVEEVYVTARKREESIQEVPIAITAFNADQMRVAGIRNVGDMEGIVPGLNMGGGGNGLKKDSNPFIRGVGQRETKVTLDPAVGTYIDGIYLARTAGALLDTVGMERVEVLRGPQGTLFGRNTSGGAISFTTKKPHEELGGSLSINVGNYGRSDASGVINLPINEKLLTRFTLSSKNNEGFFENIIDNTKWGDDNRVTGIAQLRWLPRSDMTVDLLAEKTRIRESPRPTKCVVANLDDVAKFEDPDNPYVPGGFFDRETWINLTGIENPNYFYPTPVERTDSTRTDRDNPDNRPTYKQACEQSQELPSNKFASDFAKGGQMFGKGRYFIDTETIGLTASWDVGEFGPLTNTTLKSIGGWRRVEQIADEDLDSTNLSQLLRYQDGFNRTDQYSQEFQFTGLALDDRLFFSTGVYYFHEETPQDVLIRSAGIAQGNPRSSDGRILMRAIEPTREVLETDNDAYAWYGQLDFDVNEQVQATFGMRYTHEQRYTSYSKAYAVGASMVSGPQHSTAGIDYSNTSTYTTEAGFNSIDDWVFYSENYLGCVGPESDICSVISAPPGYEDTARPIGVGYGKKAKSTSDSAWTPMFSIKYHANDRLMDNFHIDDAMTYFTFSQGFGAGGVTAGAIDTSENPGALRVEDPVIYDSQTINNYEIGAKIQAFDGRVQANSAIFYTDYKDMQITSTARRAGLPIPFTDNVGKSVIQGFEGEFIITPLSNWRILFNLAYTNADLKEWDARQVGLDPLTGNPTGFYAFNDRSDEPMPRVPRWQSFFLTDYIFHLPGGGSITPSIAARHTSEIYHGFDRGSFLYAKDKVTSDSVTFLDARISYISADEKTEISLWSKNLTDIDDYMVGAIPLVETTGTVGQIYANPRTFGLEITHRFGGE